MQHSELERIALEHAQPETLKYYLYRRNPRFDGARQFGTFISLVADHWRSGAPGLGSSTGMIIEMERLGCKVQSTPDYASCQDVPSIYHTGWIMHVLRASRARVIEHHVELEREKHDRGHPEWCRCTGCDVTRRKVRRRGNRIGDLSFSMWTNVDVFRAKQCDVAKSTNVSDSTVSRRLTAIRAVVEDELKCEGKLKT